MTRPADLILRNVRPQGGALCDISIVDGSIAAIAPKLAVTGLEIDGEGRDIIPGLHDHHLHLFATAARKSSVDLSICDDLDKVCAALRQHSVSLARGAWLRATGLNVADGGVPDRHMLDGWISDLPMRIQDRTGALWLLNSRALDATGGAPWPDCVECDAAGCPTGRIWRGDSWLRSVLPAQPPSLHDLSRELAAFGITSVTDASVTNGHEEAALFEAARQSRSLLQKLTLMGRDDLPTSHHFERGPIKLLYDETELPEIADVAARITVARQQGRGVAAHCVTLGELLFFLAALDAAGGAKPGDRIEHGSIIPQSLLADLAHAGLKIVTQPGFIHTRGDRYLATLEPHSLPDLYRLQSLYDAGIEVLAGSDAPYGNIDPWQAISAAMTRTTAARQVFDESEGVPFDRALGLFSANQPITNGMAADLCLMSVPLAVLAKGVGQNPIAATFINGTCVHSTNRWLALQYGG
jgi:predicted amidohydrolase YtcJ